VKKALTNIGLCFIFVFFISLRAFAQCEGDFEPDGDVDGSDLAVFAAGFGRTNCDTGPLCEGDFDNDNDVDGSDLAIFAADFGRTDCPLKAPLNLFNIGNSIGEGAAAYDDIGAIHHEAVWSTGFDPTDFIYTLNERFEEVDPTGYYENDDTRDNTFNQAMEGDEMVDFEAQANAVVANAGQTPSATVGMVAVFLGNNDVCTDGLGTMTDLATFEDQYRAGLDVLSASAVTKNAVIHVSGIPALYWLWIAKRDNFWCRVFVWPFVPCRELLESPSNDCGSGNSDLDPDTIHPDDGPSCIRRKEFHAAIRDDYNRIIRDVLQEYKGSGLLPNAYYIDIFDIQFDSNHINGGDCFHPSDEGHAVLAEEQWCRSPWGMDDPSCTP